MPCLDGKKPGRRGLCRPENVAAILSKLVSYCVGHFLDYKYLWAVLSCFKSHKPILIIDSYVYVISRLGQDQPSLVRPWLMPLFFLHPLFDVVMQVSKLKTCPLTSPTSCSIFTLFLPSRQPKRTSFKDSIKEDEGCQKKSLKLEHGSFSLSQTLATF